MKKRYRHITGRVNPKMFRLLVAGGRDFYDYKYIDEVLTDWYVNDFSENRKIYTDLESGVTVVHGDANGVDRIAGMWAVYNNLGVEAYPAKWNSLGYKAGHIRNQEMIQSGVNYAILFPGGKGTSNMQNQLIEAHIDFFFAVPNKVYS